MERTGNYELAVQKGNRGYFASVAIRAEIDEGEAGLVVEIADDIRSWRLGAQFGIAYAYEKSLAQSDPGRRVRVEVTKLQGHVVDTTETAVAFAAAWAFWKAFDVTPSRELTADFDAGLFHFPK